MAGRTNRFMRSKSKTRSKSRSRVSSTRTGRTGFISATPVSGKTSMKAPFKFNKAGSTLKKRVKRIEKTLKNDEVKYLLSNAGSITVSTTPVITALNFCTRGDTIMQRTADSIRCLQFELSGIMQTGNNAIVRVMIVSDKSPLGTAIRFSAVTPAIGYMFAGASSSAILPSQMMNFNNTSLFEEFRVFYDKTFNLTTTDVFGMPLTIKQKIDVEAEYKGGNAGTVADLSKNALYLIVFGSNSVGGVPTTTTLVYDSCLYFQDN